MVSNTHLSDLLSLTHLRCRYKLEDAPRRSGANFRNDQTYRYDNLD